MKREIINSNAIPTVITGSAEGSMVLSEASAKMNRAAAIFHSRTEIRWENIRLIEFKKSKEIVNWVKNGKAKDTSLYLSLLKIFISTLSSEVGTRFQRSPNSDCVGRYNINSMTPLPILSPICIFDKAENICCRKDRFANQHYYYVSSNKCILITRSRRIWFDYSDYLFRRR